MISYTTIIRDGLWSNNTGVVQLLGLCPLLAVTGTVINGLGLGIATTLTMVASGIIISSIRRLIRTEVRIPVFVLVIASVVTVIELSMKAFFFDLYNVLGIFIPLIVTNCVIIGRAETFASKQNIGKTFIDALSMGVGFTMVLVLLGGMREIIGQGTLFSGAQLMFGEAARSATIVLLDDYAGFLLAVLPPGAFIGLGVLIALKNMIDRKQQTRTTQAIAAMEPATETT